MRKKDRNDYRSMSTPGLQDEVQRGVNVDWQEIAIALAERIDTARREALDEIYD